MGIPAHVKLAIFLYIPPNRQRVIFLIISAKMSEIWSMLYSGIKYLVTERLIELRRHFLFIV